jgi:cytochrome c-type biogenesis protein CcmH/NrfF
MSARRRPTARRRPAARRWQTARRALITHPRRALGLLVAAFALAPLALLAAPIAAATAAAKPGVSLPAIERQAMCVTCKVALNESQSPQADLEREYIKELIAKGEGEGEIKRSLVAQFGPTVLGLPGTHGFDLAVYLVPAAVVLALLATVAALLPRWRRRARKARAERPQGTSALTPAEAARLEADLARFD